VQPVSSSPGERRKRCSRTAARPTGQIRTVSCFRSVCGNHQARNPLQEDGFSRQLLLLAASAVIPQSLACPHRNCPGYGQIREYATGGAQRNVGPRAAYDGVPLSGEWTTNKNAGSSSRGTAPNSTGYLSMRRSWWRWASLAGGTRWGGVKTWGLPACRSAAAFRRFGPSEPSCGFTRRGACFGAPLR
jgi:hypothetical protein